MYCTLHFTVQRIRKRVHYFYATRRPNGSAHRYDRFICENTPATGQRTRLPATGPILETERHSQNCSLCLLSTDSNVPFQTQIIHQTVICMKSQWSGLRTALPPNVNLLSVQSWSNGSLLVRLEHCFHAHEDAALSQRVTVDLKAHIFGFPRYYSTNYITLVFHLCNISTSIISMLTAWHKELCGCVSLF